MLICASDGNHGLAVAAAAGFAGGTARIFLHGGVPPNRARRIERRGADIVWIEGTYDDAVAAALAAAKAGDGILVAETTNEPGDPVGARSEERRVGKARVRRCRSRWSPHHTKTK